MSRLLILPYRKGSEAATALARGLGVLQIIPDESSKYVGRRGDVIINFGNSKYVPNIRPGQTVTTVNPQLSVSHAVNKLKTFDLLNNNGVNIPSYTTSREEAGTWLVDGACKRVFCRTTLNGHSGEGIVVARKPEELVVAPLYVMGIAKAEEYRVHVLGERVIDSAEKRRRNGAKDTDDYSSDIRSVHTGWVYAHENVSLPEGAAVEAIMAVNALGLQFGAVDIAMDKHSGEAKVLEINTSPGIEGTTLQRYVEAFKEYVKVIT